LETGSFDDLEATAKAIEPVSWIRFHKTLAAGASRAQTVLVVNAAALPAFLDEISRAQGFDPD
jgi:hypothetical protein